MTGEYALCDRAWRHAYALLCLALWALIYNNIYIYILYEGVRGETQRLGYVIGQATTFKPSMVLIRGV